MSRSSLIYGKELLNSPIIDKFKGDTGHYIERIDSVSFEYVFIKGTELQLYVFLSGMYPNGEKKFNRWSYHRVTESNVLCFLDPMAFDYGNTIHGYYYGNETIDYREKLAIIITKISKLLDVEMERIVIMGDSNAGTAALFTSEYLPGCKTVAINPQLTKESHYYNTLKKIGHLCDKRTEVFDLLNRTQNISIILINSKSKVDYESIQLIENRFETTLKPGINVLGRNLIWTFSNEYINNHIAIDNEALFLAIDYLLFNRVDDLESYSTMINLFWSNRFQLYREINNSIINYLSGAKRDYDSIITYYYKCGYEYIQRKNYEKFLLSNAEIIISSINIRTMECIIQYGYDECHGGGDYVDEFLKKYIDSLKKHTSMDDDTVAVLCTIINKTINSHIIAEIIELITTCDYSNYNIDAQIGLLL